jgi:2-polyprenyl-6-methoxyphenol hydroxylase-like FAD-dependent oxidoreductase
MPVLIVGAGPVGLRAAILLGRLGVQSFLLECHPSTTDRPKSRAVLTRTMQTLRPWDVELALRAQALPSGAFRFIWIESLLGVVRVEPPGRDVPVRTAPAISAWLRRKPSKGGAALVRPDGHVAWRALATMGTPLATLRFVLRRLVGR